MKRIPFSIFPLIFTLFAAKTTAQINGYDTTYSVVTVSSAQSFYLDSRVVSNVNGRSRVTVPVVLPEGTARWFYSFAATESKNEPLEWVGLAGQLTKLVDKTGIASELINRLVKPSGTASCDIFVLNTEGVDFFLKKDDKKWKSSADYSRQNMTGGIVEARPQQPRFSIGLSNPSLKSGINVRIEVTAIVAKATAVYNNSTAAKTNTAKETTWSAIERDALFQKIVGTFDGKTTPSVSEVSFCVQQKILKSFTPDEFKNIGENEQRVVYFRILNDCYAETHNENLAAEMTFLGITKRQLDTLESTGNFAEMLRMTCKIEGFGFLAVSNRVRHVRALLLNNQLDEALNIADPLARILPDDLPVNLHLAHVCLLKNDVKRAEKIYLKFKNRTSTEGVACAQMVNDDFNLFVKNRIFNSNFENIKRKLKIRD